MESKEQILDKLFSLQRFGIKPGLERITSLLSKIDNPQNNFKSIHVAGTNGKGSVSSMIASVLISSGYKVGLYTSPHILRFNERIKINGQEIDDEYLINCARELLRISQGADITFFEITTALAFKYFSDNSVDVAIIETGMGGRYDATNIIKPVLSVITSISFDHQEYLGNTISKIAFEKAGIIKPKTACITFNRNLDVLQVIRERCLEINSELIEAQENVTVKEILFSNDFKISGNFSINGQSYSGLIVGLGGYHQVENTQLVLATIEYLKTEFSITEQNLRDGLMEIRKNTGLIGRIQLLRENPPFVIDVSHNPSSIEKLVNTLKHSGYKRKKWNLIFNAMCDKDLQEMLKPLLAITECLMIPNLKIERASKNFEVSHIAKKIGFKKIELFETIDELLDGLINMNDPVLITGSFYLLGEFFANKNIKLLNLEKGLYD